MSKGSSKRCLRLEAASNRVEQLEQDVASLDVQRLMSSLEVPRTV